MKRPFFLIGACQRAHGIKGEVLVRSLTDDPERFFQGLVCYAMDDAGEEPVEKLTLSGCRPVPQGLLLTFQGIADREAARRLAGVKLAVRREDALELSGEGEFYYGDLLGAAVRDRQRGLLGMVTDVMDTGSGDILVVSQAGQADVLIPFLRSIVKEVDPDFRSMEVELPDGLFELYRQLEDSPVED
ncbi:MAG TPA: ribosome maturation factor RimM [Bacillota bacterium]|jgi:16S rRNA processing protein RimM|nr:16S rRNA processing protein RimM [Fastidiosipila sp.]HPX93532.1 ribosome maturation factor RimM [Bacillota bacterium]HQB81756.1 ribosome maturation factor RimM [Bacillota bacterium]